MFRSESARYCGGGPGPGPAGELRPFECVVVGPEGWERYG